MKQQPLSIQYFIETAAFVNPMFHGNGSLCQSNISLKQQPLSIRCFRGTNVQCKTGVRCKMTTEGVKVLQTPAAIKPLSVGTDPMSWEYVCVCVGGGGTTSKAVCQQVVSCLKMSWYKNRLC